MKSIRQPAIRYDDQRLVGGVPTPLGLRALARLGVTTVVDCRTASELVGEVERPERVARTLGLKALWRPLPRSPWSAATLGAFWLAAFSEPEGQVYLYSERGLRPYAALVILDAFSGRRPLLQMLQRSRVRGLPLDSAHPLARLVRQQVLEGDAYQAAMAVCERRADLFGPRHLLHPLPRRRRQR